MNVFVYAQRAMALNKPLSSKEQVSHAAFGMASEVGEILEEVSAIIKDGVQPDTIQRLKLETGDVIWYLNLMLDTMGSNFQHLALVRLITPTFITTGADMGTVSLATTHEMSIAIGHIADIAKRHVSYDKPLDDAKMLEALARLWQALSNIAQMAGLTWEDILEANIEKLEARYKSGKFTAAEAEHRHAVAANDEPTKPKLTVVE